jgi:hypothetical protein
MYQYKLICSSDMHLPLSQSTKVLACNDHMVMGHTQCIEYETFIVVHICVTYVKSFIVLFVSPQRVAHLPCLGHVLE